MCIRDSGVAVGDGLRVSAKTGENVEAILETVIARIPAPKGDVSQKLRALIIDSWYDNYVGVVMLVRVMEGSLRPKERISLKSTGAAYLCDQVGIFTPCEASTTSSAPSQAASERLTS